MKAPLRFFLLYLCAFRFPASAQHVIATIPVGFNPASIVLNQKTNRIYAGGGQTVKVIDGATNTVRASIFVHGEISPSKPLLAYGNEFLVGDPEFQQVDVIDGRTNNVNVVTTDFAWQAGSSQLGTSNWLYISCGSQVSAVNAADLSVAATIPVDNAMNITVNANTQRVYVASQDFDNSTWSIAVIDATTNTVINSFPLGNVSLEGIATDSINNRLYIATAPTGSLRGSLSVLDGTTGEILGTTEPIGQILSMLAVPEKHEVLLGGGRMVDRHYPNHLIFIDTETLKVTRALEVGALPYSIAYNPKTNRIYDTNEVDNTVSVVGN
jgi:DNA-binding beta-propeller fold protein YncE